MAPSESKRKYSDRSPIISIQILKTDRLPLIFVYIRRRVCVFIELIPSRMRMRTVDWIASCLNTVRKGTVKCRRRFLVLYVYCYKPSSGKNRLMLCRWHLKLSEKEKQTNIFGNIRLLILRGRSVSLNHFHSFSLLCYDIISMTQLFLLTLLNNLFTSVQNC